MSQQNTPGNDPNNGRDESQSPYGAQGASDAQSNPYFGTTQAEPAPDLDAAAPQLRSAEEQRLNRKALLFLGGWLSPFQGWTDSWLGEPSILWLLAKAVFFAFCYVWFRATFPR